MSDTPWRKKNLTEEEKKPKVRPNAKGEGMTLENLITSHTGTSVATARPIPSYRYTKYKGEGPDASAHRAGANDFLQVPSRFNDLLVYRDGREVQL